MEELPLLTPREMDMVIELAKGFSEKEIASIKHVSPKTVNNHLTNVRKKWDARCAVDIVRKFILSLDDPKQYFAALTFLIIQFHIMVNIPQIELRRPTRTSIGSRQGRRKNESYES